MGEQLCLWSVDGQKMRDIPVFCDDAARGPPDGEGGASMFIAPDPTATRALVSTADAHAPGILHYDSWTWSSVFEVVLLPVPPVVWMLTGDVCEMGARELGWRNGWVTRATRMWSSTASG